jgi:hypothetical protein
MLTFIFFSPVYMPCDNADLRFGDAHFMGVSQVHVVLRPGKSSVACGHVKSALQS